MKFKMYPVVFLILLVNQQINTQTISLEYVPSRPFHHPRPSNYPTQIIPPGQPWPDSPAGYTNFSQTTKPPPNLADRIQEEQPAMSGNHRPSFHPNPGSSNVSPIVPPGKPWPANPQDYGNFSQTTKPPPDVVDRFTEGTEEIGTSHRPSFHPNPGSSYVNQIIPPGKPWPASQEGYNNFSQINTSVRIDGTTVDKTDKTATEKTADDNDDDGDDEETSTEATEPSATPTEKQIITEAPVYEPKPIDFIAPIREPVPGFFQIFQPRPSFDFSYRWNYFGANPQPIIAPILPAAPQFPIIIPVIG